MNNEELILKMLSEINEKITRIDERTTSLESDMKEVKREVKRLHKDNELVLDEVERVHGIFDKRYNELKAKIS